MYLKVLACDLDGTLATSGEVSAATWAAHDRAVLEVLRQTSGGATVEYNKGAVMVLPPGATKGTGLRVALAELGYSPRNVIACGDAENDRSLFELSELAVAVENATESIKALADTALDKPDGAEIRTLVTQLLQGRLPEHRPRPERQLVLGTSSRDEPVYLDPLELLGANLGVVGSSASGKSYLAGLLVEALLARGYQVCVVDPEGDYRGLPHFPHTLVLGGPESELPSALDVITLSEYASVSLILDLSDRPLDVRLSYTERLLHGLSALHARRGRPHWLVIDEVQGFCPLTGGTFSDLLVGHMQGDGVGIVSYSPAQIDPKLLDAVDLWTLTGFGLEGGAGGASALSRVPSGSGGRTCRRSGGARR